MIKGRLRYVLCISAAALASAVLFRYVPGFADAYRAEIFIPFSLWMRDLTGATPIPLAEIGVGAMFVLFAASLTRLIVRPGSDYVQEWCGRVLCAVSTVVLMYVWLWGGLYGCSAIFPEAAETPQQLNRFCGELISSLNAAAGGFEWPDIQNTAAEAARLMSKQTGIALSAPKVVRYPEAFDLLGISGVYFPFTFESLIKPNDILPAIPFTACHELAHQAGLAREEEASFVAWLACREGSEAFRYSGDFNMLTSAMNRLRTLDHAAWSACVGQMNDVLLRDFRSANGLGEAEASVYGMWTDRAAEAFQQLNGQKAGIESYDRSVLLALAYHEADKEAADMLR